MRAEQFQIVSGFDAEMDIVLSVGASLKKLAKELNGSVIQLSVPSIAPADAPRAIVQSKDTIIHVGLNRFEVITRPPEHVGGSFHTAKEFALSRATNVLEILHDVGGAYKWIGAICNIKYPKSSKDVSALKHCEGLFDKILKVDRGSRSLSSFQVQFGFTEDELYKSYVVTGYETRDVKFSDEMKDNIGIEIEVSQFPITEAGIELTIDHNNRNATHKVSPTADLVAILRTMEESLTNLPSQLNFNLAEDM